ncbi:hypothetical protein JYU34_009667 [Plutella xylostella]|uniref:Uncharacterized protein n=2 Tax=Plutella xylostella TaxID=51655 RepID=A0ABQ7QK34_PLUXY|nr:hypothetical protein JYU34_009667 [Plutella xylostella]CAG9091365.1 unnamed protein product [Plutella xylostella]
MRSGDVLVVILLGALGSVLVRGADNATSRSESEEELPEPPMAGEKEDGALETFAKALLDIPLGFVEALKDVASAVEKTAFAFITSLF